MSASKSHRHDGNDFVNKWDFSCRRNDDRVDAAVTVGGRLFQAPVTVGGRLFQALVTVGGRLFQALVPAAEKDRMFCVPVL